MGTPESKVKVKLKAHLYRHKVYWFMPVQTGYGSITLDFLACWEGQFIAYECKAEGRKLTPRQEFVARQITNAGGLVYKVTLVNGELEFERCGLTGSAGS
jgi:hypothetical protein